MYIRSTRILLLAVLLWAGMPHIAQAAESFDSCKGYVTTLPVTITTPGTWCLKQNLAFTSAAGNAITLATRDVTLDCNDFALDNSVAGAATKAVGVRATSVSNATVRHCNIRGFQYGVYVSGTTGGHLIEDNHLDSNTYTGIMVQGDGSVARRNVVLDTGGSSVIAGAQGIYALYSVDIVDNTVASVFANSGDTAGIRTSLNTAGSISDNRVRDVVAVAPGVERGIYNSSSGRMTLAGNTVSGNGAVGSIGLYCSGPSARAKNNVVVGFATGRSQCGDAGGNDISP